MNIREKISVVEILSQLDIDLAEELETMDKGEFTAYLGYLIKKYEGRERANSRGNVGWAGNTGRETCRRNLGKAEGRNFERTGSRPSKEIKEEIKEEVTEEKIGTEQQITSNDESLDTNFNSVQEMDEDVSNFLDSFMEL